MIFVDTGAWIAFSDKRDYYHKEAGLIYSELKQRKQKFITTDYVIDETLTRMRYDLGHPTACRFLDFVEKAQKVGALEVLFIDATIFDEAESIFRKYDTAKLSFTDCTSFAVCKKYNIQYAFAFDEHFSMLGLALYKPNH
jgi:hypothetical protein